jgi:hypothetical protein
VKKTYICLHQVKGHVELPLAEWEGGSKKGPYVLAVRHKLPASETLAKRHFSHCLWCQPKFRCFLAPVFRFTPLVLRSISTRSNHVTRFHHAYAVIHGLFPRSYYIL